MTRQLVIEPEKCVGCKTCELICSKEHFGQFNPRVSAVTVVDYPCDPFSVPLMCLQCDEGFCIDVCPVSALKRTAEGRVVHDVDACIKCKMCVIACPLGNIRFSSSLRRIIKCDLCGGEPKCVEYCRREALVFVDDDGISNKVQQTAGKIRKAFVTEASAS